MHGQLTTTALMLKDVSGPVMLQGVDAMVHT